MNANAIKIPDNITNFNKMWLEKVFDKIILGPDAYDELSIPRVGLYREYNGRKYWDTYFFIRREELECRTAEDLWLNSPFHSDMIREIELLSFTYCPYKTTDQIPWSTSRQESFEKKHRYLTEPATTLMFQESDKPIVYMDPHILDIYRSTIERFQIIARATDEQRVCIYLDDLSETSRRIQFIQSLCYIGLEATIHKFKHYKNNYLFSDPEILELIREPNEFLETGYKESLYKFYKFCVSPERISPELEEKLAHLGAIVLHHQEIRLMVSSYILSLTSSIKQTTLHLNCSFKVLEYLKPSCISREYIMSKLENVLY